MFPHFYMITQSRNHMSGYDMRTYWMDYISERVQDEGKRSKEGHKRNDACIEQALCRKHIGQLQKKRVNFKRLQEKVELII